MPRPRLCEVDRTNDKDDTVMAMATMLNTVPYTDSTPDLADAGVLRGRARDDGYLFFRRLLNPDLVLGLRRRILERCEAHEWLAEDTKLLDGIARSGLKVTEGGREPWPTFYRDVLRMRDFHALAMEGALRAPLEHVFGEPVLTHSRNICRVVFPGLTAFTTPPHQDHWYIGGTTETWTTWIPLGDCPEELGGLAVLPGSHRLGLLSSRPGEGAGGRETEVPEDAVWAVDEMACGDVLMFPSLTVHQGRDNTTPDRLRLSVDFRHQPLSHPLRRDSMEPHMGGFGLKWDDIYADWPAEDPLRYYWRALPLDYAP